MAAAHNEKPLVDRVGLPWSRLRAFGVAMTLAVSASVLVQGAAAGARIFKVDQAAAVSVHDYYNVGLAGPIGQGFTPTLTGLNAVELAFDGCGTAEAPTVQVSIHEATISGPILGRSTQATLPSATWRGNARLEFASIVQLVPGLPYAIEVNVLQGCSFVGVGPDPGYPGGSAIIVGGVRSDLDLWFREGLLLNTPDGKDSCKDGGWEQVVRADGSSFANQGTCVRYVTTGR